MVPELVEYRSHVEWKWPWTWHKENESRLEDSKQKGFEQLKIYWVHEILKYWSSFKTFLCDIISLHPIAGEFNEFKNLPALIADFTFNRETNIMNQLPVSSLWTDGRTDGRRADYSSPLSPPICPRFCRPESLSQRLTGACSLQTQSWWGGPTGPHRPPNCVPTHQSTSL